MPTRYSAAVVALAYLIDPDIPKNDGAFRPLTLKLKEGTIVWPRPGAPVTLCTNHCGQEIIEAIIRALAPACPERAMAGWGRRFRMAVQGIDPRNEQAVHLASVSGAAGRRRLLGGRRLARVRASGRRPAASSSAASRCRRCAFPCTFAATSSAPTAAATDAIAAVRAASSSSSSRRASRRVGNTAGDGIKYGACGLLGGEDGKPHRYWLQSAGRARSAAQDQGDGHRAEARRRPQRALGWWRRLG